ncbi:MAG TPA: hypothetical protein VEM95_05190, partial [Thermoplasmata archaeon]|nr:hypothetical protein [Thermoplasmata archaeon]
EVEPKLGPAAEFEERLSSWAAAGYDVSPLRQVLEKEPDRARTAFFQFEQNVRKVQVLEETLNGLDRTGLEPAIDRLRALFRAPYQIWRIEAEMATLLDSADARDRTLRARTAPPPAPPARAGARPSGATNGRSPKAASRVNGLGAGAGRVNGMASPGRVNGLVNGVRAARAGLTNGITNGLGMTNGLGGRRYAAEARSRRWRLLLIPIVALVLISVSLVAPPPTSGGISVDGAFADWQGVRSYAQREIVSNPNVDLTAYAVYWHDDRLSVRSTVRGTMFGDANVLDVLWVFVDVDGDRGTGYDEGRIGADLLLEIRGGNGTVTDTATWEWPTDATDRDDWNAWAAAYLPFTAAVSQGDLECQVDLANFPTLRSEPGFNEAKAAIAIDLEDQRDSRSRSERIVGPNEGFLTVEQRPASSQINPTLSDFLVLRFEANVSTVQVRGVTLSLGPGTPPLSPISPFDVVPGVPQTVTLAVDGTGLAAGTLLSATVVSVNASLPATILGAGGRAYVGSTPSAPTVDGLFGEWNANRTDADPTPVREPNVNITNYAAQASNTTAYAFVRVVDTALGGKAAPVRRVKTI